MRNRVILNIKDTLESALNRKWIVFFCLVVFLSACADVRGPTWLTGEPDDDVLNAPRVVGRPNHPKREGWPNLGDVPAQKPVFSTTQERSRKAEQLASDKYQAQAEGARVQNIPIEPPVPKTPEAPFLPSTP